MQILFSSTAENYLTSRATNSFSWRPLLQEITCIDICDKTLSVNDVSASATVSTYRQLIQVAMPRANTEPLPRCAQVTSGRCLHLQGKEFLRTLISQLGKYSFILCDSSSPLSCAVYYGPKAIKPFMSSVPVYTSARSTNHFPWCMPRGFFCFCFGGMEERYWHDKDMNAGRA
jgi:hypothetical protein